MKKKKNISRIIVVIFPIILVLIVMLLLSGRNNNTTLIVSKDKITKGTVISNDNFDDLFMLKKVPAEFVPKDAVKEKEFLPGKFVTHDIESNTIITGSLFFSDNDIIKNLSEPVVAGIKASDISQFSGGIIRKGDYVDISVIDVNSNECVDVLSRVYVYGAYNSDGTEISEADGCAMILNILINKDEEQYMNKMLQRGSIRICRHERSKYD